MYNNTHTLSNQYNTTSNILEIDLTSKEESKVLSFQESFQALNILHSFEMRKNKIRTDLETFYEFENQFDELDFLEDNPLIIQTLPSIANYIHGNLDNDAKLKLDLLKENSDWQTLFINIYTCAKWNKTNEFYDSFLDNLYDLYPEIAQKLNLNIIPNEF